MSDRLRRTLIFIGIVVAYLLAAELSNINTRALAKLTEPQGVQKALDILGDFLRPDVVARDTISTIFEAHVPVPCEIPFEAPPPGDELQLTPTCGAPGESIEVRGSGVIPNSQVQFRWLLPAEGGRLPAPLVIADEDGNFMASVELRPLLAATDGDVATLQAETEQPVGLPYPSEALRIAGSKMLETIFMALMATTFGTLLAIPLSFLAARNVMGRSGIGNIIYYAVRTVLNISRSIEALVLAVVFAVWVGYGPFSGVLALTVVTLASLGKLFSEAIESIDPGPIEAIRATGANWVQTMTYAVIPQIVPPYTGFTIYHWDINVRISTIIGFVGGGGIGKQLLDWINQFLYHKAGTAIWAIVIVVMILDYASAKVRERIV